MMASNKSFTKSSRIDCSGSIKGIGMKERSAWEAIKSDLFNYSTTGLQFIQVQYIKTSTVQCINTLRVQRKTVEMKASRQFPYQQLR